MTKENTFNYWTCGKGYSYKKQGEYRYGTTTPYLINSKLWGDEIDETSKGARMMIEDFRKFCEELEVTDVYADVRTYKIMNARDYWIDGNDGGHGDAYQILMGNTDHRFTIKTKSGDFWLVGSNYNSSHTFLPKVAALDGSLLRSERTHTHLLKVRTLPYNFYCVGKDGECHTEVYTALMKGVVVPC